MSSCYWIPVSCPPDNALYRHSAMELSGNMKKSKHRQWRRWKGGRWGRGTVERPPPAAKYRGLQSGRENKYFQWIQFDFPCSTNFTLLSEIKQNALSDCLFRFIISVWGGLCDYSPRATKDLVTPLNIGIHIKDASFKRVICNSDYWLHLCAWSCNIKTDLT
jgi:hypothetical protein